MSSDKRDFSNFHEFPGSVIQNGTSKGWYSFPKVYSIDTMNRRRAWHILVRLITTKGGKAPARRKINWDITIDTVVPILQKYLDGRIEDIPDNTIAQMWTVQGIISENNSVPENENADINTMYKTTVSIPTHITIGKSIGKKNETTVLTQALIQARSKYLKKLQESTERNNINRFFPVAVHKYDAKPRDVSKHLRLPVAVQRKLDGGRACAYYDTVMKKAVLYSRKLKDLDGNKHVLKELQSLLSSINDMYPGIYFDGELYKHGLSLQDIVGVMRREKGSKTTAREKKDTGSISVKLEYHIFDIFFPVGSKLMKNMLYIDRKKVLDDIFDVAKKTGIILTHIIKVKTYIANTFEEETELYEQFLTEKYEGSIVRNLDMPYEFGINKEIRTYQIRKRKPRYSSEYEIVGYTEGVQGKDKGAIIWILKTPSDETKNFESLEFTSTPVGMDYDERYSMFKNMTPSIFEKKWKGKQMTIEYDDISGYGVPLRAKAKGVRIFD
jgi:ATP-dependent DNA ligase